MFIVKTQNQNKNKMLKRILIIFFVLWAIKSNAQFKSFSVMLDYREMSSSLEPPKTFDTPFEYNQWMDSLVSIHRELADFFELDYPLDHLLSQKRESLSADELNDLYLARFISSFPDLNDSIFSRKRGFNVYSQHRLSLLVQYFEKAEEELNLEEMESALNLFVFFYQNPLFMGNRKIQKKYENAFIPLRARYSNILYRCFETDSCDKDQVGYLFMLFLNAWPDSRSAYSILRLYFYEEWLYLFHSIDLPLDIDYTLAAECFLNVLYLERVDPKERVPLVRPFHRLMDLRHSSLQKKIRVEKNLREYVGEKYDIFP